jgi:tRNA(Ile)-lysidine synthase
MESEGDQEYVEALCRELDISVHIRRCDVLNRARRTSLQAAARDLRYRAMIEVAQTCGADRIAVGHTADDQAETVVLWMLRGAGMAGLSGMPAHRDGLVVRPLYDIARRDILAYLEDAGQSYRQDSSNEKLLYLRNRIRREILPRLQQIVPSSVDALCRLADICREEDQYLHTQMTALCESKVSPLRATGWAIERPLLQRLPRVMQRRIVRELMSRCEASHRPPDLRTVERVLRKSTDGKLGSSFTVRSIRVVIDQERVGFTPSSSPETAESGVSGSDRVVLTVPGSVCWPGTGQMIRAARLAQAEEPRAESNGILVSADRLSQPLEVRTWRRGDRFYPKGMKGHSKKLQDFFTDLKVPAAQRAKIPLVVAPEGIVWVVGYRQDARWIPASAGEQRLVLTVHGSVGGGR